MNAPRIVSLHSRKGGVGKTTLALSAALQLACRGQKIALIEMDSQGGHLSESLPYSRGQRRGAPDLATYMLKLAEGRQDESVWEMGRCLVVEAPAVDTSEVDNGSAAKKPSGNEIITRLHSNLRVFPFPQSPSTKFEFQDQFYTTVGRRDFAERLANISNRLGDEGVDTVILDHAPGLSFGPGVGFAWALRWAKQGNTAHVWIVSGWQPWDPASVFYELAVVEEDDLKRANTVLIVNKAAQNWLGLECNTFENGEAVYKSIGQTLVSLPMWNETAQIGQEQLWGLAGSPKETLEGFRTETAAAPFDEDLPQNGSILKTLGQGLGVEKPDREAWAKFVVSLLQKDIAAIHAGQGIHEFVWQLLEHRGLEKNRSRTTGG